MESTEIYAREWGRSLGFVIPKDIVKKENIKKGDKLKVIIQKNKGEENPLKITFGTLKMKTPTDQLLKEIDEEGWDKYD